MSDSENNKDLPYWDESLDIEERVEDLLKRLTFEEKCLLSAGFKQNSPPPIERLGIPTFHMTDGPHGVSKGAVEEGPNYAGETGIGSSTYFPTGIQMASTFNPEILYEFGQAIAEETRYAGRSMILGPAFNICRSPMNGRTFEYYSEDPYLSGELAVQSVKGIQSKRVAPCIKHYVANNFECNRFKVNAVIDKRTLNEIYFPAFKKCVEEADPWGLMSSYNKINGIYVSEHKEILRTLLKDTWGFSGVVVSDWGATHRCTSVPSLVEAGLDIEMGSRNRYQIDLMQQLKDEGKFPEEYFEDNTRRILRAYFRTGCFDDPSKIPEGSINTKEHQALARKMAEQGMILLKNENKTLPLDPTKVKKLAILGKHADIKFGRPKLGGGSSAVTPPYEITVRQGLTEKCADFNIDVVDDPAVADVAVVCVGLEHSHNFKGGDHEGSDKLRYSLGVLGPKLINKTVAVCKNTIVIFLNGSPFGAERFADNVPAILETWYGGLEVGNVVADIIFGEVNPSGKLPVSWPKYKKDIANTLKMRTTFLNMVKEVVYDEGVFIGYRHHDKNNIEPRWCFGHGLSYTNYEYSNLTLSSKTMKVGETLKVSCSVKNVGETDGAEIVQLYINDVEASVPRPPKELKGFKRIVQNPGMEDKIEFKITTQDLSFFDESTDSWKAEKGKFKVLIGSSSRDIRLEQEFELE